MTFRPRMSARDSSHGHGGRVALIVHSPAHRWSVSRVLPFALISAIMRIGSICRSLI